MIQKPSPLQISINEQPEIQSSFYGDLRLNVYQNAPLIHLKSNEETQQQIVGLCQQFICKTELQDRELSPYQIPTKEYPNWEPMACHFRNIQYNNKNVRTAVVLEQCLDFICKEYLPYYRKIFNQEAQRKRFQQFLYLRVRAIRCELYVQNIFQPDLSMRLIKILLLLETMMGQPVDLSSLNQFFQYQVKIKLLQSENTKHFFYEALELAIFSFKKQQLMLLLSECFVQIQDHQLTMNHLRTRLSIMNLSNYYIYLVNLLKHANVFTRLILWSQMPAMREIVIDHYKKARMNEKAGFICRLLGYKKMEGWIDISKKDDWTKLEIYKADFDLDIKIWITEAQLMEAIKNLEKGDK